MSPLIAKLLAVHAAFEEAEIPHAVGGAIALAFATRDPRGTRDLDLNVFLKPDQAARVLAALPAGIEWSDADVEEIQRTGQVRLWWDDTPVDLFFNNLPLHEDVARGRVIVPLAGEQIPILDAGSLVIFKAMFDRPKDWVDIEEILVHDRGAVIDALERITSLIGAEDPISLRLKALLEAG